MTAADPAPWPGARLATAMIGASVAALVACIAWWLGGGYVAAVAAGGILAGPLVAVRRARRLAGPGWLGASVSLGIQAPLLVSLAVTAYAAATSLVAALNSDPDTAYSYWAFLFVVPYGMVFGAPIAIPVSIVAGFLAHRASGMEAARARRHIGALVVAAVAASLITLASFTGLLARVLPGAGLGDRAAAGAAVRLTMTVENHSSRDLSILVDWDAGDGGRAGTITGAPACAVVADRFALDGVDWTVGAFDESDLGPVGAPFATFAEWPGSDPAITIRVDVDGRTSVVAGSRPAPVEDAAWPLEPADPCR